MPSDVYFIDMVAKDSNDRMYRKIERLFDAAGFGKTIKKGDLTAIKVHLGEIGNSSFVPPWLVRAIVEKVREAGGKPFITDTNTLYRGMRRNAVDHLTIATRHGFTMATVNAPVIIADGLYGRNQTEIEINKKHFQSIKVGQTMEQADHMIVSSHFKGHLMAGFGGALKNIAMGCASVEGKKEQHSVRPQLAKDKTCIGCGTCQQHCPADAILIIDNQAVFDAKKCIGCGECVGRCPHEAIQLNWETEIPEFTERMMEYAYGIWKIHQDKIGFINFVTNVTPECDCFDISQRTIVNDVGILASHDPVALDQACFDMVNKQIGKKDSILKTGHNAGENKFLGVHTETRPDIQISYAEELGIGTADYNLIDLSSKPENSEN